MTFGSENIGEFSLNSKYVYYQRLLTDNNGENTTKYRNMGFAVRNQLMLFSQTMSDVQNISSFFSQMAQKEFEKEKAMLEKYFGATELNYYLGDKNAEKKIIDTLNAALGLKEVYERNLQVLLNNNGQKGLITWFPTYFNKAFKKAWSYGIKSDYGNNVPCLRRKINNLFKKDFPKNDDIMREKIKNIISLYIDDITREAAILMFEAGVETRVDEKYQSAYQEMATALKELTSSAKEYIIDLKRVYHLDEISEIINAEINKEKDIKGVASKVGGKVSANIHQTGGYNMENYINFVVNEAVRKNFKATDNLKSIKSYTTGDTGQKADTVITIGLNTSAIEKWLETQQFGTREKDRYALMNLQRRLKDLKGGFVVYTNVKNYKVDSDFRSHGFSAGQAIKLRAFSNMTHYLIKDGKYFTVAIMNTIPGALNDSNYESVKTAMARSVAAFLFDDFSTIGNEMSQNATNAIHLFNLEGIYVPLSWFFYHLSQVFGNSGDANTLVRVNIKIPKEIEFQTQEKQNYWKQLFPEQSAWRYQADLALDNTTIQMHFLGAIKELLSQFS